MIPASVLIDGRRFEQFHNIGNIPRLLSGFEVRMDASGVYWGFKQINNFSLGFTWLGNGRAYDPYCQQRLAKDLQVAHKQMSSVDPAVHNEKLAALSREIRLGRQSQRLLLTIHQHVMQSRQSVISVPAEWLAHFVWGHREKKPRHWRSELLRTLTGLSFLHISETAPDKNVPFGDQSALIHHVAELPSVNDTSQCDDRCPLKDQSPHRHYLINVGRGFLGLLEQFADDNRETGIRTYSFPLRGSSGELTLRTAGRTGRLVTVYLPAVVGDPVVCKRFSASQQRLISAIVRESTRGKRRHRDKPAEPEVLVGNVIPSIRGGCETTCKLLCTSGQYVGFNGNKLRKGMGYYLTSPGGWLAKANYASDAIRDFVKDLAFISQALGLIAVGTNTKTNEILDLHYMQSLSTFAYGRRVLDRVNLRLFTGADYIARWNAFFGWDYSVQLPRVKDTVDLIHQMVSKNVSRRALAEAIKIDASYLSKILNGKKNLPSGLHDRALAYLQLVPTTQNPPLQPTELPPDCTDSLTMALDYCDRGFSVVPQLSGQKRPAVRWKRYQRERASHAQIRSWYNKWPSAGIALVLGPVSNVFVIDVDGSEAHKALIERLEVLPVAPKVISGSGAPDRYHLFFQHPPLITKAKITPWHPKLEFRGDGSIVVLPPSVHSSGRLYRWEVGATLNDLLLPTLPPAILSALSPPSREIHGICSSPNRLMSGSQSTLQFLDGMYSQGPNWNGRLFRAACDLHANDVALEVAVPALLAGAKPWNQGEEELALATIKSAYSQPRVPSIV